MSNLHLSTEAREFLDSALTVGDLMKLLSTLDPKSIIATTTFHDSSCFFDKKQCGVLLNQVVKVDIEPSWIPEREYLELQNGGLKSENKMEELKDESGKEHKHEPECKEENENEPGEPTGPVGSTELGEPTETKSKLDKEIELEDNEIKTNVVFLCLHGNSSHENFDLSLE